MAWRLAKSLATLRDQINKLSPNRSKASDGTIGDTAHSHRKSDHNPNARGHVQGMDITTDPAHGIVSRKLAQAVIDSRDPRIKYVISDGEICSGAAGPSPWKWRKYNGENGHFHHTHFSVADDIALYDSVKPWDLSGMKVTAKQVQKPIAREKNPLLVRGNKGTDVERLQKLLNAAGAKLVLDADFGDRTDKAVRAFQRSKGLLVDGKARPATWEALGA